MNSEIPDDDDYMVTLSLQLLQRHEITGHEEDLVAAIMAANQVLTWHLSAPPTEAERDRFVDEFPAWRALHDVAEGLQSIQIPALPAPASANLRSDASGTSDGLDDVALKTICREFLKSFQDRYLPGWRTTVDRRRAATRPSRAAKD